MASDKKANCIPKETLTEHLKRELRNVQGVGIRGIVSTLARIARLWIGTLVSRLNSGRSQKTEVDMLNKPGRRISVLDAEGTRDIMPKDFTLAVKDIKLAILQARAKAARLANAEALKLYFFVGGYISKKTRNAKWGSGAIDALSNQLQVELPGLRGFSATSIRYMRIFFDEWMKWFEIRHLPSDEFR